MVMYCSDILWWSIMVRLYNKIVTGGVYYVQNVKYKIFHVQAQKHIATNVMQKTDLRH